MTQRQIRLALVVVSLLLPWPLRRALYRSAFRWTIEDGASIGLSIVDATNLRLGEGARIGHFTVIRQLSSVDIGDGALIGQWNWITAALELAGNRGGYFRIGRQSAITSRHYVDCSGGVTIGDYATVAGVRSVILSHQIDIERSLQTTAAVEIGDYALISSNVCVTPGSRIPRSCVVAMGAVVTGVLPEEGALYGGVPATVKRIGIQNGSYFRRTDGVVRAESHPDPSTLPPSPVMDQGVAASDSDSLPTGD